MIDFLKQGSSFKLDPTLLLTKPGCLLPLIKDDKYVVYDYGKLKIIDNDHIDINYYLVKDSRSNDLRIIEDISMGVIFLYKEMMSNKIASDPVFIHTDKLNIEIGDNGAVEYEEYSPILECQLKRFKNLFHIFCRQLDDNDEENLEYLWCEIWNNELEKYFLGVDIHSSQIII